MTDIVVGFDLATLPRWRQKLLHTACWLAGIPYANIYGSHVTSYAAKLRDAGCVLYQLGYGVDL